MLALCSFEGSPGAWSPGLPVAMARGKHLFPFRTEKLSPSAPMVLGSQGPGRVGRRRFNVRAGARASGPFLVRPCASLVRPCGPAVTCGRAPPSGDAAVAGDLEPLGACRGCVDAALAQGRAEPFVHEALLVGAALPELEHHPATRPRAARVEEQAVR